MLTTEQVSILMGLAPATLAKMRMRGDGPPFLKLGARRVVYDPADVKRWLENKRRTSTGRFEAQAPDAGADR